MDSNLHLKKNEDGQPVRLHAPHAPSAPASWLEAGSLATVVPGGALPPALNGIPFAPWRAAPADSVGWSALAACGAAFAEPRFTVPEGRHAAAGAVIVEPDRRVWVVHPSNAYGGYAATFPKGTVDPGVSLRATALREAWEESGLQVELTGFLADSTRSLSHARYYLARRVGGCPSDMGWESQAVSLVPRAALAGLLASPHDAPLVAALLRLPV